MQCEALLIFNICCNHGISIEMVWILRSQNDQEDFLRRIYYAMVGTFSSLSFHVIDFAWGPHSIDRFANLLNAQFYPPVSIPDFGIRVLKALMLLLWIGPGKITMLVRLYASFCAFCFICVIAKLQGLFLSLCGSPLPPLFWPMIRPDVDEFANCIVDWMELPTFKEAFIPGSFFHQAFLLYSRCIIVFVNIRIVNS